VSVKPRRALTQRQEGTDAVPARVVERFRQVAGRRPYRVVYAEPGGGGRHLDVPQVSEPVRERLVEQTNARESWDQLLRTASRRPVAPGEKMMVPVV
jgi:hypothetical protein